MRWQNPPGQPVLQSVNHDRYQKSKVFGDIGESLTRIVLMSHLRMKLEPTPEIKEERWDIVGEDGFLSQAMNARGHPVNCHDGKKLTGEAKLDMYESGNVCIELTSLWKSKADILFIWHRGFIYALSRERVHQVVYDNQCNLLYRQKRGGNRNSVRLLLVPEATFELDFEPVVLAVTGFRSIKIEDWHGNIRSATVPVNDIIDLIELPEYFSSRR